MFGDHAVVSLLWAIICVAAVIGLAYWFTRYVAGRGLLGAAGGGREMEILAQLALGRDQRVVAVRAGRRYFLLGVTAAGISLLAELTEEESKALRRPPQDPNDPKPPSFREAFYQVLGQKGRR